MALRNSIDRTDGGNFGFLPKMTSHQQVIRRENKMSVTLLDLDEDEDSLMQGSEEEMMAYEQAKSLQKEVERWIRWGNHRLTKEVNAIETGIRLQERKCIIYLPQENKAELLEEMRKNISSLDMAIIADLSTDVRDRQCNRPGRTGILFGNGSLCTLGAYFRGESTGNIYALSSCHNSSRPEIGRDVFSMITSTGQRVYSRLGRCVAHAYQFDPVVDACLIQVDPEIVGQGNIEFSMHIGDNMPPGYLYNPERIMEENILQRPVFKVGNESGLTFGRLVECHRVVPHDDLRFTGNYVTVSEANAGPFTIAGDCGALIAKAVRMGGNNTNAYPAISVHYYGSQSESFSFPLKRAMELLSHQIAESISLINAPPQVDYEGDDE